MDFTNRQLDRWPSRNGIARRASIPFAARMVIIHAVDDLHRPAPRLLTAILADHFRTMPAVVITGARQTGKSTIAERLSPGPSRLYYSLDSLDVAELADRDPMALVGGSEPMTLDEVQRAPSLLLAIKRAIDLDRVPGRFLITGSANLLLMQRVSESLAGRASYLTLWPMTRGETDGRGDCGLWQDLFQAHDREWPDIVRASTRTQTDWRSCARRGGFPTPALVLTSDDDRALWFDGYVRTYLERDLQALSAIEALPDFRRLMRAVCLRLGQQLNQTDLGRDVALAQSTVHRYLNLMEASYMLVRVPAYSVNRTKRLVKSPKLYWSDTGLAMHIGGAQIAEGPHLENLVLGDLLVWRDTQARRAEILYWRTARGEEVDFVLEIGDQLVPIEVKATSRPSLRDANNIRLFRQEYGAAARTGLLLHTGEQIEWLAPDVLAVPWWRVL
jgi:uncharacterized protein